MQHNEWQDKLKSGRRVRQTLREARRARVVSDSTSDVENGTEIAEEEARGDREPTDRRGRYSTDDTDSGRTVNTLQVLERLATDADMADRLRALRARQQRLPLDVETGPSSEARTRAKQTRDELVERLLDPVLTLQETSILLDVCPTTVRRYTNRGVLNCFRTPGNQRRFRLSDVISFMERRDSRQS
jgi:hypothetical protein